MKCAMLKIEFEVENTLRKQGAQYSQTRRCCWKGQDQLEERQHTRRSLHEDSSMG